MIVISFFFLFIFPLTIILLLLWIITRKKVFGKIIGYFWLCIVSLILFGILFKFLTDKKVLKRKLYYGEYIIDRSYFPGKQADWQYNHFRFEINEDNSIYFYVTEKDKIVRTYRGTITTTDPNQYASERLVIHMNMPKHHILTSNPTTYRSAWGFNLVFDSPEFNNVYFKKGSWESIEE